MLTKVSAMYKKQTHQLEQILLDCREAARLLAISERTLWQLTNDKEIAVVRIGRTVRYDMADLRAFIAARREGGLPREV